MFKTESESLELHRRREKVSNQMHFRELMKHARGREVFVETDG